jgi:phenylacetate-CoA ligase
LNFLYNILPNFIQNGLVSAYNFLAYNKRYSHNYTKIKFQFKKNENLSLKELKNIQNKRLEDFLVFASNNSHYFKDILINDDTGMVKPLNLVPILTKETLRLNLQKIKTLSNNEGIISKTGGTTGKTLEVIYTKKDMQERFAMLDNFRSKYGYELGEKTAWFSGKSILTNRDIKKKRFWKTDYLYNVRYYSTFHLSRENLSEYLEDLMNFKPQYLVGFPSSIVEIVRFGNKSKIDFPKNVIKAIFPTAETITSEVRYDIESFFQTKMYNQYASSEGAPFIFECDNGKLHLELQSGVFEVLDNYDTPTRSGRLVVTSFTTHGTPLIRYDIGDSISLENESVKCNCGNNNPIVKEILGRIDDFIYSPENGKINLGNVSNTLKGTKGIIKFQVVQNSLRSLVINLVIDNKVFNNKFKFKFINNWIDRVGNEMEIKINIVDDIPVEESGKFRMVKNNIKNLL